MLMCNCRLSLWLCGAVRFRWLAWDVGLVQGAVNTV
jgi:hypothetical protein